MYLLVHIQVIAGAGMDVDFTIVSPEGDRLIVESRRSDGVHVLVLPHMLHITDAARCWTCLFIFDFTSCYSRVEPTHEGDYQICFDNSFSRFSEKMVFFEIIIEGQGGDVGGDDEWTGLEEPDGSLLEYKLEDIRVRRFLQVFKH